MADLSLALPPRARAVSAAPSRLDVFRDYARRNPELIVGLVVVGALLAIGLIGPLFVDVRQAQPMRAVPGQPPSARYLLGTDDQGRNLLAVMVAGLPLTLKVGFLAGAVGLSIGTLLGLTAGYLGGTVDTVISMIVDIILTVPGLLILITIAASIKTFISVEVLALVVASLAWPRPTRTIRSQVLTLRERGYIQVARRSGLGTPEIILFQLLPNLLPYLAASFVTAVSATILASIGLEVLGLGPQNDPTVGQTIYWAIKYNALLRNMWWWWIPPILVVVLMFVGLFLISSGLDEVANPRRRRVV
ncbi:MAG: ABC transporter permease [Chloroflexi bacterium]|nr:ABC transporter permease [Chloroflexota bacterium]